VSEHKHSFKFIRRNLTWYEWKCECGKLHYLGCNGFWQGWKASSPWVFEYRASTGEAIRVPLKK
jgi:hypothetical protein